MTKFFGDPDLALWTALIAGKVLLCLCILKAHFFRRLPSFSTYILATTAKSLLLFALATWSTYAAYYGVFYATSYMEAALVLFVLIECALQVLPGFDLPKRNKAAVWLTGAVAVAIGFSAVGRFRFVENRIEIGCYLAIGVTFFAIAIYALYLGLYWSRLVARITTILGLLYLIDGVAKIAMAHYPAAIGLYVRLVSEAVNILAVISWTIVILSPWGEYKITETELARARQIIDDAEANLRHVAAGGGK